MLCNILYIAHYSTQHCTTLQYACRHSLVEIQGSKMALLSQIITVLTWPLYLKCTLLNWQDVYVYHNVISSGSASTSLSTLPHGGWCCCVLGPRGHHTYVRTLFWCKNCCKEVCEYLQRVWSVRLLDASNWWRLNTFVLTSQLSNDLLAHWSRSRS